jgi:hypothetical protein
LVSGPLTNGLLACQGILRLTRFIDADRLHELWNLLSGLCDLARADRRSVRRARCKQTWFAANTLALADVAEAHRADLAAIDEAPPATDTPAPKQHFAFDQAWWRCRKG